MLELTIQPPYTFAASICDHGWPALAPNQWLEAEQTLQRVERLQDGQVVLLHITGREKNGGIGACTRVRIHVAGEQPLRPAAKRELRAKVRWMLKLDEDLSAFHGLAVAHPHLAWMSTQGRGRLLRSPTLWEDVVKTIATTNVTWGNTKAMIQRFVATLGAVFVSQPAYRAFPTPEEVAAADPALFTDVIRMGYRNAYVMQLAQEIVTGVRDLEALKQAQLPPAALKKELKSIKGIGDYAAHTLLMLLGAYGELPIDSEYRSFVSQRYFAAQPGTESTPTDKELAAIYDDWAEWKYLAYWFDHYGE
ncbi:MAG: hypothetical protein R3C14_14140 [Caldilineaceae bacterium]